MLMRWLFFAPDPVDSDRGARSRRPSGTAGHDADKAGKKNPDVTQRQNAKLPAGGADAGTRPENPSGAGGNSVTNTGRPMSGDAPSGIGAAAVSGAMQSERERQQESGHLQPGGTTRSAAGTTSVGGRGGGLAGSPAEGLTDRPADITEGRVAGPEGNVTGELPDEQATGGLRAANEQVEEDTDQEWRRSGGKR